MPERLSVSYYGADWRSADLSNLTPGPMEFDGVRVRCVESVVQSMNFSLDDPRHAACLDLCGPECKSMMYEAIDAAAGCDGVAHWGSLVIGIASDERLGIIRRAMECKFSTVASAWEALRLSHGLDLEYETSDMDEVFSVPKRFFLDVLSEIRLNIVRGLFPRPSR